MDARDLLLMQHAGVHAAAVSGGGPTVSDRTFGQLTDAQMRLRPAPGANSLAWLLYHIARVEDAFVNVILQPASQVLDEGWLPRLRADRRDIGTGMTPEEVGALTQAVDLDALRGYRDAVGRRSREVIGGLAEAGWQGNVSPEDMARAAAAGAFGPRAGWLQQVFAGRPRAAVLAGTTVTHTATHIGEAQMVRALGGFGLGI
jgi:hypothetical protein